MHYIILFFVCFNIYNLCKKIYKYLNPPILKVAKISEEKDYIPYKYHQKDAGFDLFSSENYIIYSLESIKIYTNLKIEIPKNYYAKIETRSSLASKNIVVIGGVIDENYRGEIIIILLNLSNKRFIINEGDRIAQLVLNKTCYPKIKKCKNLSKTTRNSGFGSTGK